MEKAAINGQRSPLRIFRDVKKTHASIPFSEVRKLTGMSEKTVLRRVKEGMIARRIDPFDNRRYLYSLEDVNKLLDLH